MILFYIHDNYYTIGNCILIELINKIYACFQGMKKKHPNMDAFLNCWAKAVQAKHNIYRRNFVNSIHTLVISACLDDSFYQKAIMIPPSLAYMLDNPFVGATTISLKAYFSFTISISLFTCFILLQCVIARIRSFVS